MIWRVAAAVIAIVLLAAAGQLVWRDVQDGSSPISPSSHSRLTVSGVPYSWPMADPATRSSCQAAEGFREAAGKNSASLDTAPLAPFGRLEAGWDIYLPLIAREVGTDCPPQTPGFAQALAVFQRLHGLAASGAMDATTLVALKAVWMSRRPFVAATAHGACPSPPALGLMAWAAPAEGYAAKPIQLRIPALNAYRDMVAAARREDAAISADHRVLTIFSGFRDPAADAANCLAQNDCGEPATATCSAHRTGLAVDLYLGSAPGYRPESTADPNRLYQSRSPAFRWMAANASRFGFVNYPFEPWHWEWTGEAP